MKLESGTSMDDRTRFAFHFAKTIKIVAAKVWARILYTQKRGPMQRLTMRAVHGCFAVLLTENCPDGPLKIRSGESLDWWPPPTQPAGHQPKYPALRNLEPRLSGCFADSTSPTAVTDGQRVCFFKASGTMVCFDMEGKEPRRNQRQRNFNS